MKKIEIKRKFIIPTLTILVLASQCGNSTVLAATNDDLYNLLNENPEVTTVIDDNEEVAQPTCTINTGTQHFTSGVSNTSSDSKREKGTYSEDYKYYYGDYTGKKYLTTEGLSSQHPELKEALEDYFGKSNLFTTWNPYDQKPAIDDFYMAYQHKKDTPVRKALTSKTQLLQLGDIAVENGLVDKNNTKASGLIALATYYGVVNRDDGLLNYSNSSKAYLTRAQAALMIGRFQHPDSYIKDRSNDSNYDQAAKKMLGKDNGYAMYLSTYGGHLMLDLDGGGLTKENVKESETKLEFLYTIITKYFGDELMQTQIKMDKNSNLSSSTIFKDISTKTIISDKQIDNVCKVNHIKNAGEQNKFELKKHLMDRQLDAVVYTAYKLGILKPDANGKANLFKPITMSEGLRTLVSEAEAVASH